MKEYQVRVVQEKSELDSRRERLVAFISDVNKFNGLPVEERCRLTKQQEAMQVYSDILGERIAAF